LQNKDDAKLIIGKIGRRFGVSGYVHLHSFTEPADNIMNYRNLFIHKDGQWLRLAVEKIRLKKNNTFVCKFESIFESINDMDQAISLNHCDVAINPSELPDLPNGEFYWKDLIGLQATNSSKEPLGEIIEVMRTGANDVLRIRQGKKIILVPYIESFIKDIDLNKGTIEIVWNENTYTSESE
jgi:16S rRNA processing protein RimM